jgi:2'-5' RNA ligase
MSQDSRVFVAVDLPEGTRRVVGTYCKGLPAARWAEPSQLHLTLHFFAKVSPGRLEEIIASLTRVKGVAPFPLSLRGLGVFPSGPPTQARVLWAGVAPDNGIRALKTAVDAVLGSDEDPEAAQGFVPHLTLARFKSSPGAALAKFMSDNTVFATAPWTVEGFSLYKSELSSEGALHKLIRNYPLAV